MNNDRNNKGSIHQSASNIIAIIACIIGLVAVIISIRAYRSQESGEAPFFVASRETVATADNLDYAMSLKNIGGNIRSVKCNYVDYLKTTAKDRTTGEFVEKYIKIIIQDDAVKYDSKTKSIPIIMNIIQLMGTIEYIEPILLYNADESLYSKYQNKEKGIFYDPRYIEYEFIHCLQIDYKDYQHKDKQLIIEIPRNLELDNYEIRERSDLPRITNDAVFYVGRSTKTDVGSMIFKQHGIKYKLVNEQFTFLR